MPEVPNSPPVGGKGSATKINTIPQSFKAQMNGEGQDTQHASKKHFPNQSAQYWPSTWGPAFPTKGFGSQLSLADLPLGSKLQESLLSGHFFNFHQTQSRDTVHPVCPEREALLNLEQVLEISTHVSPSPALLRLQCPLGMLLKIMRQGANKTHDAKRLNPNTSTVLLYMISHLDSSSYNAETSARCWGHRGRPQTSADL